MMKRILALWLAAMLIVVQPCYAVVTVGFGAAPVSEYCDGTDIFCTSWETGTGATNAGATGNEDTFEASSGSPERYETTTPLGSYAVRVVNGAYVESTNGGAGYGASISSSGYFRMDDESAGSGRVVVFRDNNSYYNFMSLARMTDGSTSDNVVPMGVVGKFTSGTETTVETFNVSEDEWYKYEMSYNMTTDIARLVVRTTTDVLVYDSGDITVTLGFTIESCRIYSEGSSGYITVDGIKINN